MIIMPGMKSGRSSFWTPPPVPPLDLDVYAQGAANGGTSSSLNLPFPSGIIANSLLLAMLAPDSDATNQFSFNTPAGWTLIHSRVRTRGAGAVFWKLASGSESGTENFSISATTQTWTGNMYRIEGHHATSPIDKSNATGFDSNSTWFGCNALTATYDNSLHCHYVVGGWGPYAFSTPANYTQQFDRSPGSGGGYTSNAGNTRRLATAASQQPISTCTASLWRSLLSHVIIRPAGT
jgi:hypothetical protein